MPRKKKQINAIYCLHCTHDCKQPASVYVAGCKKRDYVQTRQPDKKYRTKDADE